MSWLRGKLVKWLRLPVSIKLVQIAPAMVEQLGLDHWMKISRMFVDIPGLWDLWNNEKECKVSELCNLTFEEKHDRRRIELIAEIRLMQKYLRFNEVAIPEINKISLEMSRKEA